jgi:hypothetical protein
MKRLLVIRFPINTSPEKWKDSSETIQRIVGNEFTVLPFISDIEKVEVEIVYDPHFKTDQIGMDQEGIRKFVQVDTSTNAYMEGKP